MLHMCVCMNVCVCKREINSCGVSSEMHDLHDHRRGRVKANMDGLLVNVFVFPTYERIHE